MTKLIRKIAAAIAVITAAAACTPGSREQKEVTGVDVFAEHVRTTDAVEAEEAAKHFKLPDGFKIELFASEPEIGKPINMAFDAQGRLWVTQSTEYPFPAEPGAGNDRIVILEDANGDGRAEVVDSFVDTLNIPIGILPYRSGAIAYSIPNIYNFQPAEGNRPDQGNRLTGGNPSAPEKALTSTVLVGPFGFNDTHGMVNNLVRGYDGWVYACHGFSNSSSPAGTDGSRLHMESGNTFRFRPDGSRLEQTTFGRVNPFGQVFDEWGYLYSVDCHSSPLYQLIMGGEYPHFGKEEAGIGFAPDMKPHEQESTALSGIAYYTASEFPGTYRKNMFIGDVVKSRIYRYSFTFEGSTPVAKKEEDFLTTDDPWFRPVDIKLGPDGALYVADFYNRIIGHYEVPLDHPGRDRQRGRIWRITYTGKDKSTSKDQPPSPPRINWRQASVEELIKGLRSDNLETRMQITNELSDRRGTEAAAPLQQLLESGNAGALQWVHGLWVLQRTGKLPVPLLESALQHEDAHVRTHALRVLKAQEKKGAPYLDYVHKALKDPVVHVQRAAVELLGTSGNAEAVDALLAYSKSIPDKDTHLGYTAAISLRDLLRNEKLLRLALQPSRDAETTAILSHSLLGVDHAGAGAFLARYVLSGNPSEDRLPELLTHAAQFAPLPELKKLSEAMRGHPAGDIDEEMTRYKAMASGIVRRGEQETEWLRPWAEELVPALFRKHTPGKETAAGALAFAAELAGKYRMTTMEADLAAAFRQRKDDAIAVAAAAALLKLPGEAYAGEIISAMRDTTLTLQTRKGIIQLLGDDSSPEILAALEAFSPVPPDLQVDVVSALAASPTGKDIVFRKVRKGDIFSRVLTDPAVNERVLLNISPEQRREYDRLTGTLTAVSKEKDSLIATRLSNFNFDPAVVKNGQAVFTANCAPCHRVNDQGGMIGPQLTGIGSWGAKALAEKILDPNRNISEAFRTYTVRTKDGKISSGLYRREVGKVIIFADAAGNEFAIEKDQIEERKPSKFTLMPDHFGTVLSQEDFNSLLSFLLEEK